MRCAARCLIATACLLISGQALPASSKRNILFLMADSMDGRVLDPTSPVSQRLQMPNLRNLANEGVNFLKTYAESPQCVPSRASMFTGRYTSDIKAWSNEVGVAMAPSGQVDQACKLYYGEAQCSNWGAQANVTSTLPDAMKSLGYEMNLYGKVDVGAGILDDPKQGNATVNGFHSGPTLNICTRTADIRKPTKPVPLKMTNDMNNNVHPEDWAMVDNCVDFVSRQEETGWMLYCSVNIPHPAFQTNATWLAYVNESAIPTPPWTPIEEMHPADSYMSISKNVAGNYTAAEILEVRKTYYAMCAETDYLMGRVLKALKARGQYDDTYIIFLSDHGEMNMEHRQVWKNSMYEPSERVPLIIAGPGLRKAATVSSPTSLLDVFPTLVELAGGQPAESLRGLSLLPLLREGKTSSGYPADRFVTSQYHSNMGNTGSFMVRWQQWKYIVFGTNLAAFKDYGAQLFNIDEDPDEMHNVAAAHPDVVQKMDEQLRSQYDYQAVDKECKATDYKIYDKFFGSKLSRAKLKAKLSHAYTGFDSKDLTKVLAWAKEAAKL